MNQTPASQLPGQVIADNYNGTYYYYLRNAQGDVVKLIDKTGTTVVEYTYDSWGKLLSTTGSLAETFGTEQPFRYRSYVYDEETGWYYLQSRYYDPEVGRFISADVYLSTGQGVLGHNAYAYCLNNPVNAFDGSGRTAILTKDDFWQNMAEGSGGAFYVPIELFSDLGQGILDIIAVLAISLFEMMIYATCDEIIVYDIYEIETPDVDYPGNDSSKPPSNEYRWRGKPPVGGDKGSWQNPNTGEQFHPDLKHKPPVGPHWEYTDGSKPKVWWRIFENGRIELKP